MAVATRVRSKPFRPNFEDRKKFLNVVSSGGGWFDPGKRRLVAKLNTNLTPEERKVFGQRLERLYKYLKVLKPSQYHHSSLADRVNTKHPCQSTACAFGHAVVSGQFPEINARASWKASDADEDGVVNTWAIEFKNIRTRTFEWMGGYGYETSDSCMETAADQFFGPGVWDVIFEADAYTGSSEDVTKSVVLRRIKAVAEKAFGHTITT